MVAVLVALLAVACVAAGPLLAKPKGGGKGKGKGKDKGEPALASQFDTRTLASGFQKAISFDFLPDGKLLVAEKAGRLYLVESGDKTLLLDISTLIVTDRERGLEGIAVASDFASSRRVYLLYAYKADSLRPTGPQSLRLTYITLNPDDTLANPASPQTVILGKDATEPCPPITNRRDCPASIGATHQGGTVLSAPDGTLFVGFGDSNIPDAPGPQVFRTYNPASTAGKILHIDANGNGLQNHPFCKKDKNLTHTCTKVYARGFRNPFRFTLTPAGDPIVADVGWNEREEIDLVQKGRNYGWPCMEGTVRTPFYSDQRRCRGLYKKRGRFSKPIYDYPNNVKKGGAAAIMGPHYAGGAYPDSLDDTFFFGDYASRFIKEASLSRKKGSFRGIRKVATDVFPVQFRLAPSGNVAYVDFIEGTVNELVFSPVNKGPRAKLNASPQAGPAPLVVGFSAAGSSDANGDPLSYDWDFGDGSPHSSSAAPAHTYAAGTYTAKLRVTDSQGASDLVALKIFSGNSAPTASIVAPTSSTRYRDGQPVTVEAIGSDPEDGPLPPTAFSWDVVLQHKRHKHTLGSVIGNPAHFTTVTDHDADSFYEIKLTVTDSDGLSVTSPKIAVRPETVELKIASNVRGVPLSYGGRTINAPKKLTAAVGFNANLSAPARFGRFRFAGWSQGGRRVQIFEIPAKRAKAGKRVKITARYKG
ncbi:MAG: PQQ-dependent sugar dehydrogenase [Actinomycetota bacterium]|nr:PQQ-dependent sugar dehydrogenase [Actinomycetota bacterium]